MFALYELIVYEVHIIEHSKNKLIKSIYIYILVH